MSAVIVIDVTKKKNCILFRRILRFVPLARTRACAIIHSFPFFPPILNAKNRMRCIESQKQKKLHRIIIFIFHFCILYLCGKCNNKKKNPFINYPWKTRIPFSFIRAFSVGVAWDQYTPTMTMDSVITFTFYCTVGIQLRYQHHHIPLCHFRHL